MKARDVQKCVRCARGVGHAGIVFYVVSVQQWGLDPRGIQQTHGLEQHFGGGQTGAMLAGIMGADPDIARLVSAPPAAWVCADCAMKNTNLFTFVRADGEDEDAEPSDSDLIVKGNADLTSERGCYGGDA